MTFSITSDSSYSPKHLHLSGESTAQATYTSVRRLASQFDQAAEELKKAGDNQKENPRSASRRIKLGDFKSQASHGTIAINTSLGTIHRTPGIHARIQDLHLDEITPASTHTPHSSSSSSQPSSELLEAAHYKTGHTPDRRRGGLRGWNGRRKTKQPLKDIAASAAKDISVSSDLPPLSLVLAGDIRDFRIDHKRYLNPDEHQALKDLEKGLNAAYLCRTYDRPLQAFGDEHLFPELTNEGLDEALDERLAGMEESGEDKLKARYKMENFFELISEVRQTEQTYHDSLLRMLEPAYGLYENETIVSVWVRRQLITYEEYQLLNQQFQCLQELAQSSEHILATLPKIELLAKPRIRGILQADGSVQPEGSMFRKLSQPENFPFTIVDTENNHYVIETANDYFSSFVARPADPTLSRAEVFQSYLRAYSPAFMHTLYRNLALASFLYEKTLPIITRVATNPEGMSAEFNARTHSQSPASLTIQPAQRGPRYAMLAKEVRDTMRVIGGEVWQAAQRRLDLCNRQTVTMNGRVKGLGLRKGV